MAVRLDLEFTKLVDSNYTGVSGPSDPWTGPRIATHQFTLGTIQAANSPRLTGVQHPWNRDTTGGHWTTNAHVRASAAMTVRGGRCSSQLRASSPVAHV